MIGRILSALFLLFSSNAFASSSDLLFRAYVKVNNRIIELKPRSEGPLRGNPRLSYSWHYGDIAPGSSFTATFGLIGPNLGGNYFDFGTFSHSGSSDFSKTSDTCSGATVYPAGTCEVQVKFEPSTTGTMSASYSATIRNDHDDPIPDDYFTFTYYLEGASQPVPPEEEENACGSVIGLDSRTLSESIGIVGTNMSLVYTSRYAPEYVTSTNVFTPSYSFNREGWTLSHHHQYDRQQRRLFLGTGTIEHRETVSDGSGTSLVLSSDGSELYFFTNGLHTATYTALTFNPKYTFGYDGNQDLVSITDAYGNQTTIARDVNGRMTSITAPFGQVTTITTGLSGLIDSVTNPNSETHTLTYKTGTGLLETFEKPEGQISTFTYNANGRLIKDLGNGGNFWQLAESLGVITKDSQMGRQTSISGSYDVNGQYNRTNNYPDGSYRVYGDNRNKGSFEYDARESSYTNKTPDGRFGNSLYRVSETNRNISSTSFSTYYGQTVDYVGVANPDPFNFTKITKTMNRGGNITTSEYDPTTLTEVMTTDEGATITTVIDANERPLSYQVGTDTPTTFTYDINGRLDTSIQGSNNQKTYAYNVSGYLQSVTNALSQTLTYGYDLAGRMTSVTLPDTRVIQYTYDGNGNLTGITPPSKPLHAFTLNAFELTDEYQPPTLLGVSVVNTQYSYNMDKQLTQITRPTGATVAYSYGSTTGLLTGVTTALGTNSYSYLTNTSLVSRIDSAEGLRNDFTYYGYKQSSDTMKIAATNVQLGKVSRTFDSQHRVNSVSAQGNASTPTYTQWITYNGDDQPTAIGPMSLTYSYPSGRLSTTTLDKVSDSRTYDTYGNLATYASIYTPVSGPVVNLYAYSLTRDTLHRITSKVETIQGVTTTFTYSYDSSGRLDTVLRNGLAYSNYVYDTNGNRTSGATAGASFTATYDNQDRILSYGATRTYGYNANGDRTSIVIAGVGTQTYSWDALGNLKGVVTTAGDNISYNHDGKNRNTRIVVNGTTQYRNLYYNDLQIAARMDNSGVMYEQYVYGTRVNTPEYFYKGGAQRIITDHLGSPRLVVRASDGVVMQRLDYTDLGMITNDTNPGFQPYGYAGGLWYPHVAAYKFGARFYEPRAGRWLTKDPILFEGGDTNLFGYVLQDPINWIDAYGLMKLPSNPAGLPAGWRPDPTHRDPNGERWRYKDTDRFLDFHKGRKGQNGNKAKDHWHDSKDGEKCDEHLNPGDEVPDPVDRMRLEDWFPSIPPLLPLPSGGGGRPATRIMGF